EIPAGDAELRWIMACDQPGDEVSDLLRERFSLRPRPVDFHHGDGMGRLRALDGYRRKIKTLGLTPKKQNGRAKACASARPSELHDCRGGTRSASATARSLKW